MIPLSTQSLKQTIVHISCSQVRILVASVGLEVLSLKRVRLGGYRIPRSLNFGDFM